MRSRNKVNEENKEPLNHFRPLVKKSTAVEVTISTLRNRRGEGA